MTYLSLGSERPEIRSRNLGALSPAGIANSARDLLDSRRRLLREVGCFVLDELLDRVDLLLNPRVHPHLLGSRPNLLVAFASRTGTQHVAQS